MKKRVVIALNTAWNLLNFRSGLIRALLAEGYEVVAVAPHDDYAERLSALGCRFVALPMDTQGTHPGRDALLLWRFFCILREEKPDVFLGYTVKPNVYGAIAAHLLGIPVVNNIAGLGTVFIKGGWLNRLVRGLYRVALSRSARVFFQNDDDLALFVSNRLVKQAVVGRLPGSGVDLKKFQPCELPDRPTLRFLLVARMLWDKGVGEFVEAARLLRHRGVNVECCLLGFLDVQNPAAISRDQMSIWASEGLVQYLGVSDEVSIEIAKADCVVLPSYYREGTPRALLEAAAMGRPIITADSVGCREVVDDSVNGFLCQPRSAHDLAEKMEKISSLTALERKAMGQRGRIKMEEQFDECLVIEAYLKVIRDFCCQTKLNHL